jgi:hypothetical protein
MSHRKTDDEAAAAPTPSSLDLAMAVKLVSGRGVEGADQHLTYPEIARHGDAANLPKHKRQDRGQTRYPASRSSTPAASSPERSRRGVKHWGVGAGGATSMGPRSREEKSGIQSPHNPTEKRRRR